MRGGGGAERGEAKRRGATGALLWLFVCCLKLMTRGIVWKDVFLRGDVFTRPRLCMVIMASVVLYNVCSLSSLLMISVETSADMRFAQQCNITTALVYSDRRNINWSSTNLVLEFY